MGKYDSKVMTHAISENEKHRKKKARRKNKIEEKEKRFRETMQKAIAGID